MYEDLDQLVARIPDGALLALPPDYSGCATRAVHALVRRGVRGLKLLTVPQAGLLADVLIGAGCVAEVETAAVTLGEHGAAPRFAEAVRTGEVVVRDSTCPAIHAALQAAEKGLPFMPLRGLIGSDVLAHRADWKTVDNPFADGDPIVVLPAIRPDVALIHAPLADRDGNVWIGVRREMMLMAHAAASTLVTVERVVDASLLADPGRAAGTIPGLYVTALAEVPGGARPLGLLDSYRPDDEALAAYARAAATREGFDAWLEAHVLAPAAAQTA